MYLNILDKIIGGLLTQMARAAGNCMTSVQVRYNPLTNVIGSGVHY